jgi:Collagen triple helix repeat (20 copies)
MLSRVHSKLGTAGLIVAILALVVALTGVAFAAAGLNSKQKKEVKKIAKSVAKAGPEGKQGPKGDTGAKGDQGPKGETGSEGKQGAEGKQGNTGEAGMCSEEEPDCTLAPGATMTGIWSAAAGGKGIEYAETALATISFPLRVSPAPIGLYPVELGPTTVGLQLKDGSVTVYETSNFPPSPEEIQKAGEAYGEACPGNFGTPEAASGFLCIYVGSSEGEVITPNPFSTNTEAPHEFGVTVPFKFSTGAGGETGNVAILRGSWAVGG